MSITVTPAGGGASAPLTLAVNGLGTSPTQAETASNTTAAAAGAQQVSPTINWLGQGWKTNATAASQPVELRSYLLPVQGAAQPFGDFLLQYQVNGGGYTNGALRYSLTAASEVQLGVEGFGGSYARLRAGNASTQFVDIKSGAGSDAVVDTGSATTSIKLAINGTTAFTIKAGCSQSLVTTVAALPAAATAGNGARAFVSDANATTFQSIVAGGGANNVPVFSDGTNWRIG